MFAELSNAMNKVCGLDTDNCMLYAGVGAEVLNALGYPAKAVAGSAAWRIGPGDGDCIGHAMELLPQISTISGTPKAGLFHCWIESQGAIIDFTTGSLRLKAQGLDRLDGGKTQVDWAPNYLLTDPSRLTDLVEVCQGHTIGAHGYVRNEELEKLIFKDTHFEMFAVAVLQWMK